MRYYDPVIGRFTTADPARSGNNLYVYCGSNPILNKDPSGRRFPTNDAETALYPQALQRQAAMAAKRAQNSGGLSGSSISGDYTALADQYGKNSYQTLSALLNAPLAELVARTIYGEQTQDDGNGQLAVAWTMVNRVLAQETVIFTDSGKSTDLFNVITHGGAYTTLVQESGNLNSYKSHSSSDSGWVNAVKLAQNMVNVLSKYYPRSSAYSHSDRVNIRAEVTAAIGVSPIGGTMYYLASGTFNAYTTQSNGSTFYNGNVVYDVIPIKGNTFFNYKGDYDVGL